MNSRFRTVALGVSAGAGLFLAGVTAGANPGFSAGIARAAQSIGQSIVGDGKFHSVRTQEPDGPDLEWDIYLVDNPDYKTNVNIRVHDEAGALETGYRVVVAGGEVTVFYDPAAVDDPNIRIARLANFVPPAD